MDRRFFLSFALTGWALGARAQGLSNAAPASGPMPADLLGVTGEAYFTAWINDFYARALAQGFARSLLDRQLSGLSADPRVAVLDARQPEFAKPVSDYVNGVISSQRIALGRAKRDAIPQFAAIEQTYGVPREILIGVWAMESGFGANVGDMDVVRSLATLAALGRRRPWAEGELLAALRILSSGAVSRAQLRGSWAGAMGQTQFIPSTYLSSAVDGDGDGRIDIWGSAPDALASAANLLARGGWRRGEGWAREVTLPAGFDVGLSEGPGQPFAWWQAKGVRRADGQAWRAADAAASCVLILPSGASGPAFLLLPNHFAIRTYNNSLAYALGVGMLADRFDGAGPLVASWPHETPLSLTQRLDAQTALIRLGFNPGQPDGVVGAGTRAAVRAWQRTQGLPADGYLSPAMVDRLRAAAGNAGPGKS
jgi:membrane-bound lytic murein transglycosylase B